MGTEICHTHKIITQNGGSKLFLLHDMSPFFLIFSLSQNPSIYIQSDSVFVGSAPLDLTNVDQIKKFCTGHVQTFFSSLFSKQCSITTIYIAFTWY